MTRMIKDMENSYEERLKRQIISSKTVTTGSVEKKKVHKMRDRRQSEILILLSTN